MAKQPVNVGAAPNDGLGDPLRSAFIKLNENFDEVYQSIEDLQSLTAITGQAYATWSGTGLIFDVVWPVYYIEGVRYEAGTDQVTLDAADVTNPRLDVIALDATGAIKITGTPAVDPVKPTIDNLTQLEITTILIAAGATTPTEITNEDVYDENTEWTGSSTNGTVDFDSTASPFSGSKSIECDAFTNGQRIEFVDGVTHEFSDFSVLRFYVNLRATFATTTGFIISFYNGASLVSSEVTVTNGLYNFTRTIVGSYQLITVPISAFTFLDSEFDKLRITFKGSNGTGFFMDDIVLQAGGVVASTLQNALTTINTPSGVANVDQPFDTFVFTAGSGLSISASGKTINFALTGGAGHVIQNAGTPLTNRENLNFSGALQAVDDAGNNASVVTVKNNGISDALLRQSAGVSVVGRSANSTGNVADIAAGANNQILRRVSDAVGFGALTAAMAPNNLWTYAKIQQASASKLLGNPTGAQANVSEIGLGTGLEFNSTNLRIKQSDLDALYVSLSGNENVGGVKTFTSAPIIPDEAYGAGWDGSLEPPTKNAVYDKIETIGGGGHTIQDEGTPLTQRTNLNFVGASVSVTDDAGNDATVVTISAAGLTSDQEDQLELAYTRSLNQLVW
jgi:hypothetical protein